MKVLLDENLTHRLRFHLPDHEVVTVTYAGWSGVKNGQLLRIAEAAGYEVFVTADQNMEYQQNMQGRLMAIVRLSAQDWPGVRDYLAEIRKAVDAATPGSFGVVACGKSQR